MSTWHSAHVECRPVITSALYKDNQETRRADSDVWPQAARNKEEVWHRAGAVAWIKQKLSLDTGRKYGGAGLGGRGGSTTIVEEAEVALFLLHCGRGRWQRRNRSCNNRRQGMARAATVAVAVILSLLHTLVGSRAIGATSDAVEETNEEEGRGYGRRGLRL
ncbi:hypothetical protein GW17_00015890 [Ensete ventricosum]|nr:hypothetical protein GW17_00015890 [Ensete ventricosum]